jgi:hypothetical protein
MSDETEIQEDDIRAEHLREVSVPLHWAYLFGLLGGSFVLMLLLIAALDA